MSFRVWHKKLISQGAGFDVYHSAGNNTGFDLFAFSFGNSEADGFIFMFATHGKAPFIWGVAAGDIDN